jgi:hypothetical protein
MFRDLNEVERYFVYEYSHLDDLSFLRDPRDVFSNQWLDDADQWIVKVGHLMRRHGGEGDGKIQIMWFPPFVPISIENAQGAYVWVVKQDNNGTAFIASPVELPFQRLLVQNEDREVWDGRIPVGKVHGDRQILIKALDKLSTALVFDLNSARDLADRADPLCAALIERAQGRMVQQLQSFLDDCYLQVLQEVILEGNRSGLKLRKATVRLDPSGYLPNGATSDSVTDWFTLRGFVSDMCANIGFRLFPTN